MASEVQNNTTQQVTLNLLGGNAVTLMPRGSADINGPTDRANLLEGEENAPDVVNARTSGRISLRTIVAPEAPKHEPPAAPEPPTIKPARTRKAE